MPAKLFQSARASSEARDEPVSQSRLALHRFQSARASSEARDRFCDGKKCSLQCFNPRALRVKRATKHISPSSICTAFQSARASSEARDDDRGIEQQIMKIEFQSARASSEARDQAAGSGTAGTAPFQSARASSEARDLSNTPAAFCGSFNPRALRVKRATCLMASGDVIAKFQSARASSEARDSAVGFVRTPTLMFQSARASSEARDLRVRSDTDRHNRCFNPRALRVKRATIDDDWVESLEWVSIRARFE